MSLHHQMMLQRYGLGRVGDMYGQVVRDPILTPILGTIFAPISIGTGISASSIAGAISASGGWMVLNTDGAKK